nr:hypothetical protein [Spirosoma sp. KUDC1026]
MIVSYLDLLLNYVNRFYNRQFITRRHVTTDLLTTLDTLLTEYVNSDQIRDERLPTVRYLADQLSMSPNYLSDLLKKTMGQSDQQYINNRQAGESQRATGFVQPVCQRDYLLSGLQTRAVVQPLFQTKNQRNPVSFPAIVQLIRS